MQQTHKLKVNLKIGGPVLNTHMNIDPLTQSGGCNIQHDLTDLTDIVDHNSCSEFLANDCLDYFPVQMKFQILTGWLCKLAHGGKFVIMGLDIREAARLIHNCKVDPNIQANALLYGTAQNVVNLKKGLITWEDATNMIMANEQFKITDMKFDGPRYVIVAERN